MLLTSDSNFFSEFERKYKDYEKELREAPKLVLRRYSFVLNPNLLEVDIDIKDLSLTEALSTFFLNLNRLYVTCVDNSTDIYCGTNKRRSIGDIYRLFLTYYREDLCILDLLCALNYISLAPVINTLNAHFSKSGAKFLSVVNCPTIRKKVYYITDETLGSSMINMHYYGSDILEVGRLIDEFHLHRTHYINYFKDNLKERMFNGEKSYNMFGDTTELLPKIYSKDQIYIL